MKSEKNVAGKRCSLVRFGVNPHNLIFDVLMALDMVLLFVVQGGHWMPHRVLGIGLCVLLAVHVYQHRKWFVAFRRGKWTRKRVTRMLPIAAAALLLIGIVLGFLIPSGGEGVACRIAGRFTSARYRFTSCVCNSRYAGCRLSCCNASASKDT